MDTNKPTLPGFTAEAGLYMTRNHYRLAADGTDAGRTLIVPQRDDLRCGPMRRSIVRFATPPLDLAIPSFGCQNHILIDRGFGFIRRWSATDAAAHEGRRLREGLLDKTNT